MHRGKTPNEKAPGDDTFIAVYVLSPICRKGGDYANAEKPSKTGRGPVFP